MVNSRKSWFSKMRFLWLKWISPNF